MIHCNDIDVRLSRLSKVYNKDYGFPDVSLLWQLWGLLDLTARHAKAVQWTRQVTRALEPV